MAVLGGELWLVGGEAITGLLPTPDGQTSVYRWVSERRPSEAWPAFVARSYADTIAAIQSLPRVGELDFSVGGEIYYNLVWADETA